MQQLSGLDTSFLSMETATTRAHVASVIVLDPSTSPRPFTFERQRELFAERLHLVPPFTRRLVEVPFGLDHPYWIEDPAFDLDYHLRHVAVPAPGGPAELAELAAAVMARPLDRQRPLWLTYIIEGLEGGRVAQLTKIHHSAVDGVSGAEILGALLDLEPDPRPPPYRPRTVEPVPSQLEMLARGAFGLLSTPRAGWRLTRSAMPALPAILGTFVPGLRSRRDPVLSRPAQAAPRTPFNGVVGSQRSWSYGSLSLERIKAVKNATAATVNDVVMALCAGALRRYLAKHDALPGEPLLAFVPISVRTPEQVGTFGNRVSAMVAQVPTHLADPLTRLAFVQDEMSIAKEEHAAIPADLLQDVTQFTPPSVLALAGRVIARTRIADRIRPPFNVVISNVPGPQFPLYAGGARMEGIWPLSPIVDGIGLNMTLMSYDGNLDYGLLASRDLMPEVDLLGDLLAQELDELAVAADVRDTDLGPA